MKLQKTILNQYMQLSARPTLREIANETGIQITRVFRILNGSKMKLEEYEIFNAIVKQKMGLTESLENIAFECSMKLSPEAVKELEQVLRRKIEIWKLTKGQDKEHISVAIA